MYITKQFHIWKNKKCLVGVWVGCNFWHIQIDGSCCNIFPIFHGAAFLQRNQSPIHIEDHLTNLGVWKVCFWTENYSIVWLYGCTPLLELFVSSQCNCCSNELTEGSSQCRSQTQIFAILQLTFALKRDATFPLNLFSVIRRNRSDVRYWLSD